MEVLLSLLWNHLFQGIFHIYCELMHSALRATDLFFGRTFWEWKRERGGERAREETKADVTDFLAGGKKQKITCFRIFLRWGQNPRIPPDPQMVSITAHRGSWERQYLAASTKSYWQKQTGVDFPADEDLLITEGDMMYEKKLSLDTNKMSHSWD